MFRRLSALGGSVLGAMLCAALPSIAHAGITLSLDASAPSGLQTLYTYSESIAPQDQIRTGDYFRIYDFAGLTGTPVAPAGWAVTVSNSNPTPAPFVILQHGDDPTIPNLTFTYTGTSSIPGPTVIPGFTAFSTYPVGSTTRKDYVGQDTQAADGAPSNAIGSVLVPQSNAVPEPATAALLLLAPLAFVRCRHA